MLSFISRRCFLPLMANPSLFSYYSLYLFLAFFPLLNSSPFPLIHLILVCRYSLHVLALNIPSFPCHSFSCIISISIYRWFSFLPFSSVFPGGSLSLVIFCLSIFPLLSFMCSFYLIPLDVKGGCMGPYPEGPPCLEMSGE